MTSLADLRSPLSLVFFGAALALVCSSLVGVLLGQWLARILPPERLELMAGLLMIFLGLWLGLRPADLCFSIRSAEAMDAPLLLSTFLTVFLAELGDKTQLATVAISGTSDRPLAVFLGSSAALILASLVGVLAGGSISNFIPEIYLKLIASLTFLIIGSRLIFDSLNK